MEDVEKIISLVENSYDEIKPIYESIQHLSEKIKSIAIDKEVLELEAKLLERIIVTSKTIEEWHEYVKSLIKEMNSMIAIDIVFVMFVEDKELRVDIFWCKRAEEDLKKLYGRLYKNKNKLRITHISVNR